MSRVLNYISSSIWAMREREFSAMLAVAARNLDALERIALDVEKHKPETMTAKFGTPLANTKYTEMRDSVAVIDVNGRLAKRMDFFTEVCEGGTSTELLLKDFQTALENPAVSSIVFNIDSGGGEAFGINEISQHIYNARGKKPIKAYVSGLGCSGAYWIASACDEVICDKSSFLGSIGVVSVWMDDSKFYEMLGIDKRVITSKNAPKKRLDLNKPEDAAEFQGELDAIEKVFIQTVARNRKKKMDEVIVDFNQGGVLVGSEAVKVGMADRTDSLETVIKELQKGKKTSASKSAEGENMSFTEKFNNFLVENGWKKGEAEAPDVLEAEKLRVEKEKAERELATFKAEQLEKAKAQISTDAEAYFTAECKAGRAVPAEKDKFLVNYAQAATDDLTSPLAEGSRLANFKAGQEARKPNGLTEEQVDTEANHVLLLGKDRDKELNQAVEAQVNDYVATVQPKAKLAVVK